MNSVLTTTDEGRKAFMECLRSLPTDATLRLEDGTAVEAHRGILALTSEYFRAAFFEFGKKRSKETVLRSINVNMLKRCQLQSVVDYSYDKQPQLSPQNVQDVLEAADYLGALGLVDACHKYMLANMSGPNLISFWRLSQVYMMMDVTKKLYHKILEDFFRLANDCEELMETTYEEFSEIASADALNVKEEDKLWMVCMKWMNHDPKNRKQHLFSLLKTIRVYWMDETAIREMIEAAPALRENPVCMEYLGQVIRKMHSSENLTAADANSLAVPREPHEVILLINGWLQAPSNFTEVYDPRADRHTIMELLADDETRAYHKCALVGLDIYVIGGFHGDNNYHKHCRKLNLPSRKWSHVTPMHVERCYVSVAVVCGKIYAIGGYNGRYRLNTAEVFDIQRNQWTYIRPMEFQRSDASSAVLENLIYAVGGFTGVTCNKSVERYDPRNDSWTSVASMNAVRSGLSCVELNGKIYALGGSSGRTRLNSCEVYNPALDKWTYIKPMYTPRSNFAAVVCDAMIYVFGGYTGESTTALCECYSPVQDEWYVLTDMNKTRSALAALTIPCFEGINKLFYPQRRNIFLERRPLVAAPTPAPPTSTRSL